LVDGFTLVDVGCSGGIEPHWTLFGDGLRAVGFDPLEAEIERLRASAPAGVSYRAARVGWREMGARMAALRAAGPILDDGVLERASCHAAWTHMGLDFQRDVFNRGTPVALSDDLVELDDLVGDPVFGTPDFVKIDTDGADFEVLLGARRLLATGVLGVEIECQLHGGLHSYAGTFSNIDNLLRSLGFLLVDFEVYRYARSALPAPFVYDFPAQTQTGPVQWADALYLRDPVNAPVQAAVGFEVTPERLRRLVCLHELYGLPDGAAELIVRFRDAMGTPAQATRMLDGLVPSWVGPGTDYERFVTMFAADPTRFYPSRIGRGERSG
jgi:FkbM family methyltransferase